MEQLCHPSCEMSTIQNARCRVRATAKALLKGYRETGAWYFFAVPIITFISGE